MRSAIIAFAFGVAVLQSCPELPGAALLSICAAAGMLCALAARGRLRAIGAAAAFGFCWAALLAHGALSDELALADEGQDITITGVIDSLPYEFEGGARFFLRVEEGRERIPARLSLAWYGNAGGWPQTRIVPGQRWQLRVRLQRPHGNANPHGFDYEVWLLEQGIRATGYVRQSRDNRRLDGFVPGIASAVGRARWELRERIRAALPGKEYAGVVVALVVGDQRSIDQSDWTVFNRTGVGHLVSISGLHITMVAGLAALAASFLWRRSFFTGARLPLLLPAQKVAALAGVVTAVAYVLLAGFGIPAQRTLYMLTVVAAAVWAGRATSMSNVLAVALGVVLLLDPWAVLAAGFWLSFGAVAAILYATAGRSDANDRGAWPALRLAARTQYAVTLGLVPLSVLLFSQVSLVGPVANAVAIPVVSLVATPLALAGSIAPPGVSELLLGAAHACIATLAGLLAWMAAQPYAVWSAPAPGMFVFACAVLGTAWLLAPRGWPVRWLGAVACLPLLAAAPTRPAPGQVSVTAFDVGQGMAVLVETHGHRLLYDTGPAYGPASDAGNRVIGPYLRARGIHRLDGVVVSHSDMDHVGGALSVLEAVETGWLLSSLPRSHPAAAAARRHVRCAAGQRWEWDGVVFSVLHPSGEDYAGAQPRPNALSCVLRISSGADDLLLAGDIEAEQEARLVASGTRLESEVLLVPHHGSGTSSTRSFLEAVSPRLAIFQVGHRNRYRHPKAEVFERYRQMGIARLRTDASGALLLKLGGGLEAVEYRRVHARYWYPRIPSNPQAIDGITMDSISHSPDRQIPVTPPR
ncbi:MAG TPA: DNA internalization-related competence protein ComEC/Rec2 [Telluria sp.]|nr:DNA internalization-related competence protein ComEC/Rec2 [Telluria sp.]